MATPCAGGIDFVVPDGHWVHHDGDMVLIRPSWEADEGRYLPSMVIALISRISTTDEVPTVEMVTGTELDGLGSVTPTGARIELLGHDMAEYRFEAHPETNLGPLYVFHALPRPVFGPSAWQPFPLATLYLADTPGGVLAVGAIGTTEPERAIAQDIFDRVAPTIELDGLRSQPVEVSERPPPEQPPALITETVGEAPLLTTAVSPIPAGDYTLRNVGTPIAVEIPPGWWVQGNFHGLAALTGDESFGPGDRGIEFRTGLDHIVAVSTAYEAIGDPLPLPRGAAWPSEQFPTLLVESETHLDLDGVTALRFDVEVDPDATCEIDEPCEFHLVAAHPIFPDSDALLDFSIRKGYSNRVWLIDDGVAEPITIVATAAEESWLDDAEAIVGSIRFGG